QPIPGTQSGSEKKPAPPKEPSMLSGKYWSDYWNNNLVPNSKRAWDDIKTGVACWSDHMNSGMSPVGTQSQQCAQGKDQALNDLAAVGEAVGAGFGGGEGSFAGRGASFGRVLGPAGKAAPAARTFVSTDAHVGEAANAIERAFPGRVKAVNNQIPMHNGLKREIDIDLGDLVVQVKKDKAKGLTGQIQQTQATTGRRTIGYAPDDMAQGAWKNAARQGIPIAQNEQELIDIIRELSNR